MSGEEQNDLGLGWEHVRTVARKGDESNRPSPRSGHTFNIVGTNAYLFGGLAESTVPDEVDDTFYEAAASSDLYRLSLFATNGMEWQKLKFAPGQVVIQRFLE